MAGMNQGDRLHELVKQRGILKASEIRGAGIHSQVLTRFVREGILERIEWGRYRLVDAEVTEHHGLVAASAAVPNGFICLLSALAFHGIGTQLPSKIWMAIERRAGKPDIRWPPLEIVRFSGKAYTEGIETHPLEGRNVHIYSVAKTLADTFKYRNKIGLDIALEALRETWRERRATIEEIEHYAAICRVDRVMRPYLASLVA